MNYSENSDFVDPSQEQLQGLAHQETDAGTVVDINDLRRDIGSKIDLARNSGLISREDADHLGLQLEKTSKDKHAVLQIGEKVSSVIEESRQLISAFSNDEEVSEQEISVFKELSLEQKREHLALLKKKLASLQDRVNKLSKFLPEAEAKLKNLKGREKARFVEELNERRENVAAYAGMMERFCQHFSKISFEQFLADFAELSPDKQREWMKLFEDTQAKPRAELTKRFQALPASYREGAAGFFELSRHEKEALLLKLEEERGFEDTVDHSPDSRHLSAKSRQFAKEMFRQATPGLRRDMMVMLKKHMKAEADLSRKFEQLPDEFRRRHPDFYELDFEKKTGILDSIDKQGDELKDQYAQLLEREFERKVIGRATFESYQRWFAEQNLHGKVDAIKPALFQQEMLHRRNLKRRFETELPQQMREANQHFYELSGHERLELFEKLRMEVAMSEAGKNPKNPQKTDAPAENTQKKSGESSAEKDATAQFSRPVSERGQDREIDDQTLKKELARVKENATFKKKVRHKNITEGLADLAYRSDLYNEGISDSGKKDRHLASEKVRHVQRKLVEHTGGKMVAGAHGEKSRKVRKVDLGGLDQMNEDDVLALKKEVTDHQGEKSHNVYHLQLTDPQSGNLATGAAGKKKADVYRTRLQREMAQKAARNLELSRGGRPSGGLSDADRKKLEHLAEEDDLKIDLREAA